MNGLPVTFSLYLKKRKRNASIRLNKMRIIKKKVKQKTVMMGIVKRSKRLVNTVRITLQ